MHGTPPLFFDSASRACLCTWVPSLPPIFQRMDSGAFFQAYSEGASSPSAAWSETSEKPNNQKTREGCGCPKFPAGKVFRQISTLLENDSPIFRQREMLSLPRFAQFPARKTAARKLAAPAGTLLDFLLRDRHSLLELF